MELLKRINTFYIQFLFSVVITAFCIVSIHSGDKSEWYYATISGIMGYWFEAPINRTTKE